MIGIFIIFACVALFVVNAMGNSSMQMAREIDELSLEVDMLTAEIRRLEHVQSMNKVNNLHLVKPTQRSEK
jgi:hypothetical protein